MRHGSAIVGSMVEVVVVEVVIIGGVPEQSPRPVSVSGFVKPPAMHMPCALLHPHTSPVPGCGSPWAIPKLQCELQIYNPHGSAKLAVVVKSSGFSSVEGEGAVTTDVTAVVVVVVMVVVVDVTIGGVPEQSPRPVSVSGFVKPPAMHMPCALLHPHTSPVSGFGSPWAIPKLQCELHT